MSDIMYIFLFHADTVFVPEGFYEKELFNYLFIIIVYGFIRMLV